jgi:hypothetical protein
MHAIPSHTPSPPALYSPERNSANTLQLAQATLDMQAEFVPLFRQGIVGGGDCEFRGTIWVVSSENIEYSEAKDVARKRFNSEFPAESPLYEYYSRELYVESGSGIAPSTRFGFEFEVIRLATELEITMYSRRYEGYAENPELDVCSNIVDPFSRTDFQGTTTSIGVDLKDAFFALRSII